MEIKKAGSQASAKGRGSGLPELYASTRYSRPPILRSLLVRASRLSRARAPHGTRIRSVKHLL